LYGNHVLKSHIARITEDTPQYSGVIIYNINDVALGFGTSAKSMKDALAIINDGIGATSTAVDQKITQINLNWKISDSFHLKKYKILTLIDKIDVKEEYNSVANEEIYQQLINEVETAKGTNSTWQLVKELIIIKKIE
jgi:hypothetical protein